MTKKSIGSTEFAKGIQKYFLTFFQGKKEEGVSTLFLIYRDCMTKLCPHSFLDKNVSGSLISESMD